MGASAGKLGSVFASLWSVLIPPSVVLSCLMAGGGRTGAVGGHTPCHTERCLSPSFLSACIDTSPVGGPQAPDDAQRCAPRGAQGDERLRGDDRRGLDIDGVGLYDHLAKRVGRDGTAGMEQAEVADVHEAVREHGLEEPAEQLYDVEGGVRGRARLSTRT
jgi:hypothetical protein